MPTPYNSLASTVQMSSACSLTKEMHSTCSLDKKTMEMPTPTS